jgi:hypothetical protein
MEKSLTKNASETSTERKQRGKVDRTVMFPVAPPATELPTDYAEWLGDLKQRIHAERLRVVLASNAAMVLLYWEIGRRVNQLYGLTDDEIAMVEG